MTGKTDYMKGTPALNGWYGFISGTDFRRPALGADLPCSIWAGSTVIHTMCRMEGLKSFYKLVTMDVSTWITRKGAANCVSQCELQTSVNDSDPECILHLLRYGIFSVNDKPRCLRNLYDSSPWDMESADAQPTSVGRMSSGLM